MRWRIGVKMGKRNGELVLGFVGLCWVGCWRLAGVVGFSVFILPPSIGEAGALAGAGLRSDAGKAGILKREWGNFFLFWVVGEVQDRCWNAQQM